MKKKPRNAVALTLLASALSCFAAAPAMAASPQALSTGDQDFLKSALASGVAEVMASQVINDVAPTTRVDAYAMRLRAAHQSADSAIQTLALLKGMRLSPQLASADIPSMQTLVSLSPQDAPDYFLNTFGVQAHQAAITLFENEIQNGQDYEVKAFARSLLPALKMHLKIANQLLQNMGGGSGGGSGGGNP
jgi:putative membrane protein